MCSVFVDTDCNKCGQTSRLIVGTEIQTRCDFESSLLDHYYLLRGVHCLFYSESLLELPYRVRICHDSYLTVSSNLGVVLLEDFLHSPSSSKSSTRPCSTSEPRKSTEHSAIQEGSVHCTVAAIRVSCLLSTIIIETFGHSFGAIFICYCRLELCNNFSFFKLVVKPDSLLLETRRSETSSEGLNQTSTLLLIESAIFPYFFLCFFFSPFFVYKHKKNKSIYFEGIQGSPEEPLRLM